MVLFCVFWCLIETSLYTESNCCKINYDKLKTVFSICRNYMSLLKVNCSSFVLNLVSAKFPDFFSRTSLIHSQYFIGIYLSSKYDKFSWRVSCFVYWFQMKRGQPSNPRSIFWWMKLNGPRHGFLVLRGRRCVWNPKVFMLQDELFIIHFQHSLYILYL